MGVETSKLRASSLRLLRTLSGRKNSSKYNSSENLSRNEKRKHGSSRQTSGNKPKSDTVRSKTKWPYPHVEKDFLPVYHMKTENEKEFTVINIIASGAYGSVLRGIENKTKREIAIKVIDKSRVLSEGQGAIQQCKDEVLIQSELPKSPYIVQLVAFWQTRNRLYLVLEYIPNGELFDLWKSVRVFSESFARFYLSEIAMAIDFLHRNNVVYRDLKMENILLDADAHTKIIDFGLSKKLREGERTATTCGTLQYTAPEVLRGEPYEHSVDWWSMGILGYALMNGKFPVFGAKNHVEMRTMVANHQYRMPLHLSNEAADVLTLLLQKSPNSRIKGLDDLMKARFFKECLSFGDSRLDLRKFLTKEDLDKIPDSFHLKPQFEIICDVRPDVNHHTFSSTNEYAEPLWKMTSGKMDSRRSEDDLAFESFETPTDSPVIQKHSNRRNLNSSNQELKENKKDYMPVRQLKPSAKQRAIPQPNSQSNNFRHQMLPIPRYKTSEQRFPSPEETNFTLPVTSDVYTRARNI